MLSTLMWLEKAKINIPIFTGETAAISKESHRTQGSTAQSPSKSKAATQIVCLPECIHR